MPSLLRFLSMSIFIFLTISSLMRLLFFYVFYNPSDPIPLSVLLKSFYIGAKFDLRLALLIHIPLLFAWIKPLSLFKDGKVRRSWLLYLTITMSSIFLLYIIDFGHFSYLQTRLEAATIRYLYNPITSLEMIWQTYPVIPALSGLLLFGGIYYFGLKRYALHLIKKAKADYPRLKKIIIALLTVIVFAAGIYGKLSYYPLRWSDAFFSPHPFASQLGLNPVLYLLVTFQHKEAGYDIEAVKKYYPFMVDYLGIKEPDREKLNFIRKERPETNRSQKPNIVIVILESLAAHKTGIFGNPLNPTPNIDVIAKESLFFRHFYVQSPGTARSVFTFITGLPDLELQSTSTRNPRIVSQHTIINAFEGYEKFYFIGGSANWANIRGLLLHNIPGIHLYEEGTYKSKRVDVWGISDLQLFEEAHNILKEAREPFFAIIQTSGSHRPYTIPEDNRGFKAVEIEDEIVKKYGFVSTAEFNSFRFLDHSVGFFMRLARDAEYFKNTIFVFFGDHGLPGRAPHMIKGEELLELNRIHVPLIIYSPGLIKSSIEERLANEMDVLPTVASLAGLPYINTTLGRDLMNKNFDKKRFAFHILDHGTNPHIGLLGKDFYFVMNVDGTNKRLHLWKSDNPRENVIAKYPADAQEMESVARAIFETARYMRYHNTANSLKNNP